MILLRKRLKHEKDCSSRLIDAHYPKDILESVGQLIKKEGAEQPLLPNRLTESTDVSSKASSSEKQNLPNSIPPNDFGKLIEEALTRDVVEKYDSYESTTRSADFLSKLDHSDRRNSAVIAVKFFSQSEPSYSDTQLKTNWSSSESILEHRARDVLYALTSHLASFYGITPVRRVGGTWVGCIGFFRSAGNELKNCLSALEFCAHILRLANKEFYTPVALAFEHGMIVGGFVRSPKFDVYGQEVRNVLQMVDCHYNKRIIIGDQARYLFSQAIHSNASLDIKLIRTPLSPPWLAKKLAECYTLGNPENFYKPRDIMGDPTLQALLALLQQYEDAQIMDLIDRPILSSRPVDVQVVFSEHSYQNRGYDIVSNVLQPKPDYEALVQQWDAGQTRQQIATKAALKDIATLDPTWPAGAHERRDIAQSDCSAPDDSSWSFAYCLDPDYWKEDLGIEFKTTIKERYGMDHHDVMEFLTEQGKHYPEKSLEELHEIIEDALYLIVRKTFLVAGIQSMFYFENASAEDIESIQSKIMKRQFGETEHAETQSDSFYSALMAVCGKHELDKSIRETPNGEEESLGMFGFVKVLVTRLVGPTKYRKIAVTTLPESELSRTTQNLFMMEESKQVEESAVNNDSTKSKSDSTREPVPAATYPSALYHRTWEKYLVDSRLAVHHNLLSFMINLLFVSVSWLFLREYFFKVENSRSDAMISFMKVFSLHLLLQLTLERVYGKTGSIIMILLRVAVVLLCPDDILLDRIFHPIIKTETYGDIGGDVPLLLFLSFRIPSHFRQSALLSFIDG
eukprot:gene34127-41302_t